MLLEKVYTVDTLITHSIRWTTQGMGYQRLWVEGGMLKIDSENDSKNCRY